MRIWLEDGKLTLEPETTDEAFDLGDMFGSIHNSHQITASGRTVSIYTDAVTQEEHALGKDEKSPVIGPKDCFGRQIEPGNVIFDGKSTLIVEMTEVDLPSGQWQMQCCGYHERGCAYFDNRSETVLYKLADSVGDLP